MFSAVLFDFGGTLDADGVHPRDQMLRAIRSVGGQCDERAFHDTYTAVDRWIIEEKKALGLGLAAFNELFLKELSRRLWNDETFADGAIRSLTATQSAKLKENTKTLLELGKTYQLGIVSNFSGNLRDILEEQGMRALFSTVTDSFHEGVEKPNAQIFLRTVARMGCQPKDCVFVGDHLERDVQASQSVGLTPVWLSEKTILSPENVAHISRLSELPLILARLGKP